ncbi:MAG: Txe/YoeB family addiction module toxin [Campylobacterales bacterium]|nr:Txe/YoeB family addiction module toxin [Campylobacterales bacterium]
MIKKFADKAWEDYLYWQQNDIQILKKINRLIKEIEKNSLEGIGEPELLKYNWSGYWSRRITREHRLVYKIQGDVLWVAQCKYHY